MADSFLKALKYFNENNLYFRIPVADYVEVYKPEDHDERSHYMTLHSKNNGNLSSIIADIGSLSKGYMVDSFEKIEGLIIKAAADKDISINANNLFVIKDLKQMLGLNQYRALNPKTYLE